ncbi:RNA-binding protein Ro60-like [Anopheles nili]|uniref:RNA-binding protein Ro60-like n=1 Tax=Anopheles nili TaxID=185578 RepID=UPI00237ADFB9|nr:RNA-binding protein Ro60-like [Anopheles nili]
MDLKMIQRYLFIGNDGSYAIDLTEPLDVPMGIEILTPVVKPAATKEPMQKMKPKKGNSNPKNTGTTKSANMVAKKLNKPGVSTAVNGKDTTETKVPQMSPLLAMIKTTIKNKTLCRTDECLFALAFCAREFPTCEEKHAVYDLLPEVIRSSHDLFMFISFYIELAVKSGHAGFGHGLRKAITRWYEKHTPMELVEMFARAHGFAGWTHKDVIAKVHPKVSCPNKQFLIEAAMKRTSQLGQMKLDESNGKKNGVDELVKAFKRYETLLQFKSAPNVTKALELIKQHGAKTKLELLPRHLRRSAKIWEALYPGLTYRELLNAVLPMQDFRLLKEGDTNANVYAEMLTKRLDALETEQIHPINVQLVEKLYSSGKRYQFLVKEAMHKRSQPEMSPPLKPILDGLKGALDHSILHHPRTGIRYFITLDLRVAHSKKFVFRNRVVTCFEAMVLLAFSIFKREKSVFIGSFTETDLVLSPVSFDESMNWEQALKCCAKLVLPKTKVSLAAPIKLATAEKIKIDMFITITDSLIRVNPSRLPPIAELNEYRKKFKLHLARYVAISLSGNEPSINFPENKDVGGMLELCGYNAYTAKFIEAFAKNLFF